LAIDCTPVGAPLAPRSTLVTRPEVIEMSTGKWFGAAAAVCVPAVAVMAIGARNAVLGSESITAGSTIVHAERSGIRFGTQALSGRVNLVASDTGLRWRILGVTGWRQATSRVLLSGWDTTRLSDGRYFLQLEQGRGARTQVLFVRNYTYLNPEMEANASAGLERRSSDGRAVVGVFRRRSYRPGETAVLDLWHRYPSVQIEVLHVGPEEQLTLGNETMEGVSVAGPFRVAGDRGSVHIRIGGWESGLYTVRMTSGRKVGFAPFIVRPKRLGLQPVAVVEPTNTWQAYNFRDADGDGKPDTWYYWWGRRPTVDLLRPYMDRGVPPHFRKNDLTFIRWLARTGRKVDMLAQEDIERVSGDRLSQLYRLIIFPGHHEYVTEAEYDAVSRYRNLGGHLAFLSANNFFWRVNRVGNRLNRIGLWRDLGRPESALVGVQYFTWNQGKFGARPYDIVGADHALWLFAGTGLENGDRFGFFGTEADRVTPASPAGLHVLATISHIFNARHSASMTYYESPSGARVFAAGAFTLAGPHVRCAGIARFLANLWDTLAGEPSEERYAQADLGSCPYTTGE